MRNIQLLAFILITSFGSLQAQEIKQQLNVALKENVDMKIIVDGKPFDYPLELINPDYIASIKILKGEEAMEKYQLADGLISIVTKGIPKPILLGTPSDPNHSSSQKIKPLVILDGEVVERSAVLEISPDIIEQIEVIKGPRAMEEYNASEGVILINTKEYTKLQKKKKGE